MSGRYSVILRSDTDTVALRLSLPFAADAEMEFNADQLDALIDRLMVAYAAIAPQGRPVIDRVESAPNG